MHDLSSSHTASSGTSGTAHQASKSLHLHGHAHMLLDLFGGHGADHLRQLLQLVDVHAHHLCHSPLFLGGHGLEHLGQLDRVTQGFHSRYAHKRIDCSLYCWLSWSSRGGGCIGHWLIHHFNKGCLVEINDLEKFGLVLTNLGEYSLEHAGVGLNETCYCIELWMTPQCFQLPCTPGQPPAAKLVASAEGTGCHPSWSSFLRYCNVSEKN